MRALGGGQQQFSLGRLAGLLRLKVDKFERAQTQRPPRQCGAPGVVVGQSRLGTAARLADGRDRQLHEVSPFSEKDQPRTGPPRWALSTAQIFSML